MEGATPPNELIIQQQQHVFEGHAARIFSLALCTLASGTRIAASASHDRTVRIWDLTHNKHLRTLTYADFVWRVFLATTAVGRVCVIAFISAIDKIYVTDFETGEEMYVLTGRLVYAGIINLYNSPVIVTLINDVDIAIADAETGVYIRYIRGGFEKAFRAVVSNTSRPVLVFNTWNAQNRRSSIQAYQLYVEPTETERSIMPTTKWPVTNLTRSSWAHYEGPPRDEPMIADNMRIVFEGDSRDGITSLVISQTGKPVICTGHYDNVVRVWDLKTLQLLMVLEGHYDWVVSVTVWKGIEPLVISGSSDGTIKVWDLENGNLICTCEGHMRDVWAVTVTTGPRHLIVSASADRTVRTWDINHVLFDMRWLRRCNFAMFLACCGFISKPSLIHGAAAHAASASSSHSTSFSSGASSVAEDADEADVSVASRDFDVDDELDEYLPQEPQVTAAVDVTDSDDIIAPEVGEEPAVQIGAGLSLATFKPINNQLEDDALQLLADLRIADDSSEMETLSENCERVTFSVFQNVNLLREVASFL
jgi:WD40 repeat protein